MPKLDLKTSILLILILIVAATRLLPHEYNFSPLGAIALFGAAYFTPRYLAFVVPLAAVFLSDLYLNNIVYNSGDNGFVWAYDGFYWVYACYLLTAVVGILMLNKVTIWRVAGSALVTAVLFFLITNFACWPGNPLYSQDLNGLITCYTAGLPFFRGTLLGNLIYSGVLFGLYYLIDSFYLSRKPTAEAI